ncbi:MAG TPA: patatin-like phospholipase family protein [Rhizomicrobium sp.]|nr:patatin-like phospholipase family protein [Rhizomicrobium sp.]
MRLRDFAILGLGAALCGCAVNIENAPINVPVNVAAVQPGPLPVAPVSRGDPATAIGVAFSGGGTRAAAFSFGVLKQLARTQTAGGLADATLIDDIDFVSGVSGGLITASYFGYAGDAALTDFRDKFLVQDLQSTLHTDVWDPRNWLFAWAGGVNDRRGVQRWFDAHLFHGATFSALDGPGKPIVWINASDIYNETPFVFDDQTFGALCSDLSRLPLSEAVAASAAVPVAFAPIVMQSFPSSCDYELPVWAREALGDASSPEGLQAFARALSNYHDPAVMRYVKLLDGGLIDNYGLLGLSLRRLESTTPYGPMNAAQAATLKRLLFVVVDAGQSTGNSWVQTISGPEAPALLSAVTSTAMAAGTRGSFDMFLSLMEQWHDKVLDWRSSLTPAEIASYRGTTTGYACGDFEIYIARVSFSLLDPEQAKKLSRIPTTLALPADQVDALIAGGAEALNRAPAFQNFLRSFTSPKIALVAN